MTTLIDCGVSFKGTDDFVTCAAAGWSKAARGAPLALILTVGNSALPAALFAVLLAVLPELADASALAFDVLSTAALAASAEAACARTSVGVAEKASSSAAWIWR
ncbi:hypothetical protein [Paraburkholderia sp. J94]|uniref:hypothetical protein n=1 Tax=Paraburkholderia sp. J94 TaxID=2805441 RepID=UPI002AB265DE|nr:hypothetical protein [Paraburkholderia sp. J94]